MNTLIFDPTESLPQPSLYRSKYPQKALLINLHLSLLELLPGLLHEEDSPLSELPVEELQPISWPSPGSQGQSTQRTPWLLAGMALMRVNSYFPQLFFTSSLWAPV
ncbi:hypothetical protein DSO57_1008059 [Entomophthora muscae]|uniref:Uncharacterized protein n=1 Tax=Entomophthora muscae TaxID=34485 RepID=A0ACC2S968_9FUNG|nr:hypothetical protein DSO57_1008059 [Entomophthora muscae]